MAAPARFTAEHSALLVVDVQGKLLDRIDGRDGMLANVVRLIKAAGLLGVPVLATENNTPKGWDRASPRWPR